MIHHKEGKGFFCGKGELFVARGKGEDLFVGEELCFEEGIVEILNGDFMINGEGGCGSS